MKITTAAIKLGKLIVSLPRPFRHPDIAIEISHQFCELAGYTPENQGFLTDSGEFVDRKKAFEIAKEAGQLIGHQETNELYTEDLW